jgi:hypothetical protein
MRPITNETLSSRKIPAILFPASVVIQFAAGWKIRPHRDDNWPQCVILTGKQGSGLTNLDTTARVGVRFFPAKQHFS